MSLDTFQLMMKSPKGGVLSKKGKKKKSSRGMKLFTTQLD
jgi:hypothetical protein